MLDLLAERRRSQSEVGKCLKVICFIGSDRSNEKPVRLTGIDCPDGKCASRTRVGPCCVIARVLDVRDISGDCDVATSFNDELATDSESGCTVAVRDAAHGVASLGREAIAVHRGVGHHNTLSVRESNDGKQRKRS